MTETTRDPSLRYSPGEEIVHATTHGVGALASLVGLAVLVALAHLHGGGRHMVAAGVFGGTLVLLYMASTLYHAIPGPRAKRVLRVVDHTAIYLLIAGTYTPFTLVSLRGPWGWTLFGLVWGLAAVGIAVKLTAMGRFRLLSVAFYLLMGWLVVIAARPMSRAVAAGGLALLAAGGLAYTLGIVFYAWRRPYHHAVWHLFVLAGSTCHYFAVLLYVLPLSP